MIVTIAKISLVLTILIRCHYDGWNNRFYFSRLWFCIVQIVDYYRSFQNNL